VQALATLDGTLLAVTDPVEGRTHDRRQTWNTGISRIRAVVEHAITHLEQWKPILAAGYRARLTELPTVIRIVTTL
jgi:hypothetical protein